MSEESTWDWPLLYYISTVVLNMSEKRFWTLQPKMLFTLAALHSELNSSDKKEKPNAFIDQLI